jgi:hypothetical protein
MPAFAGMTDFIQQLLFCDLIKTTIKD